MYTTCSYISLIAQANVLPHTYSVSRLLHKQTQNYTRVCISADPNFALYELESSEIEYLAIELFCNSASGIRQHSSNP